MCITCCIDVDRETERRTKPNKNTVQNGSEEWRISKKDRLSIYQSYKLNKPTINHACNADEVAKTLPLVFFTSQFHPV